MKTAEAINVWDVKAMQDKLNDVIELMFAAGAGDEAREMLKVFEKILDRAAD